MRKKKETKTKIMRLLISNIPMHACVYTPENSKINGDHRVCASTAADFSALFPSVTVYSGVTRLQNVTSRRKRPTARYTPSSGQTLCSH